LGEAFQLVSFLFLLVLRCFTLAPCLGVL
jgi:hypothetical protein